MVLGASESLINDISKATTVAVDPSNPNTYYSRMSAGPASGLCFNAAVATNPTLSTSEVNLSMTQLNVTSSFFQ